MTTPHPKDHDGNTNRSDRIMEHEYDGIQEYDNPMPRWWLLTFAATVVFSIVYYFNVGPIGNGKGRVADYDEEMRLAAVAHPAPTGSEMSADQLLAIAKNHEQVEEGHEVFKAYCVACHGADGGGIIGPNLADTYWIHGSTITDIYRTVTNGVLEKGMPPWGKSLKPDQLNQVVAYVTTLQGTHPANPKAPQGVQATP